MIAAPGEFSPRDFSVGDFSVMAASFTYIVPANPTSVVPNSGSTLGGTVVTIGGTGFTGTTTVTFGGVLATGIHVVDDTTITATAPPHAAGTVQIEVLKAGDTNGEVRCLWGQSSGC